MGTFPAAGATKPIQGPGFTATARWPPAIKLQRVGSPTYLYLIRLRSQIIGEENSLRVPGQIALRWSGVGRACVNQNRRTRLCNRVSQAVAIVEQHPAILGEDRVLRCAGADRLPVRCAEKIGRNNAIGRVTAIADYRNARAAAQHGRKIVCVAVRKHSHPARTEPGPWVL